MTNDPIRQNLRMLLGNGHAHMGFEEAVRDFPMDAINRTIPNGTYTPWRLVEHMRLTQRDSLDYMRDAQYRDRAWPAEFWPAQDAVATEATWRDTIDGFRADLAEFVAIVEDESVDLNSPIPTNPQHTLLRSITIIAAHNHFHIGEFAILREVMGTWGPGHEG
jgi:hypothetical protein